MLHAVIAQVSDTSTTTTSTHINAGVVVVAIIIQVGIAIGIAVLASRKGYSGVGFFFFGFFCWIPALIVALVLSNKKVTPGGFGYAYGPTTSPVWTTPGAAPAPTALPPAGWYPDPGGTPKQRYWDGNSWTEHLN